MRFTVTGTGRYSTLENGKILISNSNELVVYPSASGAVTIPGSVTSIRDSAFSGCSLTSITIPSSVTSIGEGAFSGCSSLTSVTFGAGSNISGENFAGAGGGYYYSNPAFPGDLRAKYYVPGGGPGTYTRWVDGPTWTKR